MTESREERPPDDEEQPDPRKGGPGKDVMYPASDPDSGPAIEPGGAGYEDRDPATEVPRMPSQPETQDD